MSYKLFEMPGKKKGKAGQGLEQFGGYDRKALPPHGIEGFRKLRSDVY